MLISEKEISKYKDLVEMPLYDLMKEANEVRKLKYGNEITTCSIVNAKSGKCSENCKFCAQSAHYNTGVNTYPLISKEEIIRQAKQAAQNGALRFGIVTSGKGITPKEFPIVEDAISFIARDGNVRPCASLGVLDEESLKKLKEAGLKRIHHNLETSERFYPSICSTHPFIERVKTIETAKQIGLEVCSGGIFGIGESWEDRIEMALILKKIGVDNVPINFLNPIKGTPLENQPIMSIDEALRIIAIYRIILESTSIEVAGGREIVFKDSQLLIFMAGANSIMIGGYLTQRGREVEKDLQLIKDAKVMWDRI